jgi:hypothetical protein
MRRAVVLLTLLSAHRLPQHAHAARARTGRAQATAERAEQDGGEPTPFQVLMEQGEQAQREESPPGELEEALVALEETVEGAQDTPEEEIRPTSEQPEQAPVSTRRPLCLLCCRLPRRPPLPPSSSRRRRRERHGCACGTPVRCPLPTAQCRHPLCDVTTAVSVAERTLAGAPATRCQTLRDAAASASASTVH